MTGRQVPELTPDYLDRVRRDFKIRGVGFQPIQRGGKQFAILKGTGGQDASVMALVLLDQILPMALIQKGGVLRDGRWEVLLWLDPSPAEYKRREDMGRELYNKADS